jgi:hypothetical protein
MFIFAAAPAEVNSTPAIVFALPALANEAEDFRPTAGPDFTPSLDEEAEAAALFNGDDFDVRTDAEWEEMAEDAAAMDAVCSGHSWL